MKKFLYITYCSLLFISINALESRAQVSTSPSMPELGVSYPWNMKELIEPADLATEIRSGNTKYIILNIGAVEDLPGATHIGPVSDLQNMKALKTKLVTLPKNAALVIYCGCCPFTKCPNIRPAYLELKKLGFTNVRVLNLPANLKTNWISQNYPLANH